MDKNKKIALLILIVALIIGGVFYYISQENDNNDITKENNQVEVNDKEKSKENEDLKTVKISDVKALNTAGEYLKLDSGFEVFAAGDSKKEDVLNSLEITPEGNYSIEKSSKGTFIVKPPKTLLKDSIYNVTTEDNSWSFQTEREFEVARTYPRNEANYVDINTGIEVRFNSKKYSKFEENFQIEPNVKGKFRYDGYTAIFVPDELEELTNYKVTIKKGVLSDELEATLKEDYSFSFKTARKSSSGQDDYDLFFNEPIYTFPKEDVPEILLDSYGIDSNEEVDVKLYRYKEMNEAKNFLKYSKTMPSWMYHGEESYIPDLSKVEEILSMKKKLNMEQTDYNELSYLRFDDNIDYGIYLLEVSHKNKKAYTSLQISDLLSYVVDSEKKDLIWINDARTGKAVEKAKVNINNQEIYTNEQGIAEFELKQDETEESYVAEIEVEGHGLYILPLKKNYTDYWDYYYSDMSYKNYWNYIYTDRFSYLPNDNISVWGFLKDKKKESINDEVKIQLTKQRYENDRTYEEIITEKELQLTSIGTYTTEIELKNLNTGYYHLKVKIADDEIETKGIYVENYEKPQWKVEVEARKDVLWEEEYLEFDVSTKFYDGTTLPNRELTPNYKYTYNYTYFDENFDVNNLIKTDENGELYLKFKSKKNDYKNYRPYYTGIDVYDMGASEVQISGSANAWVFPKKEMIELSQKTEENKAEVEIKTSKIDISKFENKDIYWLSQDDYREESVDIPVKLELYKVWYEKTETGSYYDRILRKNVKMYNYNRREALEDEYEVKTVNGKANLSIELEENFGYLLRAKYLDSNKEEVEESIDLYELRYPGGYNDGKLNLRGKNDNWHPTKMGEVKEIEIIAANEKIEDKENDKVLYMILKNGIVSYEISDEVSYKAKMEEERIPNFYVKAVYFEGNRIYETNAMGIYYDESERELNIELKTNKEEYKPRDEVKLEIKVTDKDGNPKKADVNVSCVDESYFTMYEQYIYMLSSIYTSDSNTGINRSYISYIPLAIDFSAMAEAGEGGDEYVRSEFEDNPAFETITTNEEGIGTLTFKLPDNLTSWRLTAHAVSDDVFAGNTRKNITAKLPCFITPVISERLALGDKAEFTVKSFGSEFNLEDTADYEMVISKDGKEIVKQENKSVKEAKFDVEGLKEGKYEVVFKGDYKDFKDGVKREFEVFESNMYVNYEKKFDLTEKQEIDLKEGNVELYVYNKKMTELYDVLESLFYFMGERVENEVIYKMSLKLIEDTYGEERYYFGASDEKLMKYQMHDGGIAPLPSAGSEPDVTAKVAMIGGDLFDKVAMKNYFEDMLLNENLDMEDKTNAYLGLAALKAPVLVDIRTMLKEEVTLEENRIKLGMALALIGDLNGANEVYKEIVEPNLKTEKDYAFVDIGEYKSYKMDVTAWAGMLGAYLGKEDTMKMIKYCVDNKNYKYVDTIQKYLYAKKQLKTAKAKSKFKLNDEEFEIENRDGVFKTLTKEEYDNLKFEVLEGEPHARVSYKADVSEIKDLTSTFEVKRRFEVYGESKENFELGDIVKVTLNLEKTEDTIPGFYEVTSMIPAGFILMEDYKSYAGEDLNVVKSYMYISKDGKYDSTMVEYYIRPIIRGTYQTGPVIIKHFKSDLSNKLEGEKVEVK